MGTPYPSWGVELSYLPQAEDGAANGEQQQSPETVQSRTPQQQSAPEKERFVEGFPEGKPLSDMSDAERSLYWENYARKHENTVKAFKGLTPQKAAEQAQELETLREKGLSADQKAIKDAEKAARAAADAEWRPKMQRSELRAIASEVLKGDQLNAWLAGMNPAAFADENGEVSHEKVMGHLTAAFGGSQDQQGQQQSANNGRQQAPAWGQGSGGGGTPSRPGDAGKAAAEKRFGTTKTQ